MVHPVVIYALDVPYKQNCLHIKNKNYERIYEIRKSNVRTTVRNER
jgi:hypothetical protein